MAQERKRAWVFLEAKNDEEAAANLKDLLSQGTDECVVIRADRVGRTDDFPFNIVVPVDAENEDVRDAIIDQIFEISGASRYAVAPVVEHIPRPPHMSLGFITQEEYEEGIEKGLDEDEVKPGLQGASPGRNPWG